MINNIIDEKKVYDIFLPYFKEDTELVDNNFVKDLDILTDVGLYQSVNYCETIFGNTYLNLILTYPKYSYEKWQHNITILKKMNVDDINHIAYFISETRDLQKDVLWLWKEKTKEEKNHLENVMFKKNKYIDLNRFTYLVIINYILKLYIQPIYSVITPAISMLSPYFILKYQMGLTIPFKSYIRILKMFLPMGISFSFNLGDAFSFFKVLSILFGFLYIYNIYNNIQELYKINNINWSLYRKLLAIKKLVTGVNRIITQYKLNINIDHSHNKTYITEIENYDYSGNIINRYNKLDKEKDIFIPDLINLGQLDLLLGFYKLFKECYNKNYPICFSRFLDKDDLNSSYLKLLDFWNPTLFNIVPVANSIELGGHTINNMIITGPNAGGKTTTMKAIIHNIYMSIIFGFSFSSTYISSRYDFVFSHIHKIDRVTEYSLFQSEIKHFSEIIERVSKSRLYFGIMDELFTSTTPDEGASCSYAMSKYLAKDNGNIIVTTHYMVLSTLAREHNLFFNASMECIDGKFTYYLKRGYNNIHLALELLLRDPNMKRIYKSANNVLKQLVIHNQKLDKINIEKELDPYPQECLPH